MTTKKIDPLTTLHGEEGLKTRNAAIVYLYYVKEYSIDALYEITDLAVSTLKTYVKKFADLLDWAKEIFAKGKNYVTKSVTGFWCYIDKITMGDGSIICKIGQTTRSPEKRANELSWKKNGVTIKPVRVEVMHKIECKDSTAMQNMEDCLRLGMTAIDSTKYVPNDRLNSWEDDYPQRILNNDFVKMGLSQFAAA